MLLLEPGSISELLLRAQQKGEVRVISIIPLHIVRALSRSPGQIEMREGSKVEAIEMIPTQDIYTVLDGKEEWVRSLTKTENAVDLCIVYLLSTAPLQLKKTIIVEILCTALQELYEVGFLNPTELESLIHCLGNVLICIGTFKDDNELLTKTEGRFIFPSRQDKSMEVGVSSPLRALQDPSSSLPASPACRPGHCHFFKNAIAIAAAAVVILMWISEEEVPSLESVAPKYWTLLTSSICTLFIILTYPAPTCLVPLEMQFSQTDLILPARESYFTERNSGMMMLYERAYIFVLVVLGADTTTASQDAKDVVDFEIQLAHMTRMIESLMKTFKEMLQENSWMTQATRDEALKKLSFFTVKVGYPDLSLMTRPLMRKLAWWDMAASEVNAYYDPQNNEINLLMGISCILNKPLPWQRQYAFDEKATTAMVARSGSEDIQKPDSVLVDQYISLHTVSEHDCEGAILNSDDFGRVSTVL
ncbi:hypothetical protein C0Q70_21786 [Pomacea canaliculata]|uniref:Peptidase M13 N-terminal domain-containing protein n=1 Tax=Pomacea canaliculata TaxID=400727 RepID=A0A2T7NAN9_POMCA|nr:hypothetical protein C0Q70_21786 [Pomacea canaliculata]